MYAERFFRTGENEITMNIQFPTTLYWLSENNKEKKKRRLMDYIILIMLIYLSMFMRTVCMKPYLKYRGSNFFMGWLSYKFRAFGCWVIKQFNDSTNKNALNSVTLSSMFAIGTQL